MSCFNDAGKVIREAYEKLEPGGWLELQDVIAPWTDGNFPPLHSASVFNVLVGLGLLQRTPRRFADST